MNRSAPATNSTKPLAPAPATPAAEDRSVLRVGDCLVSASPGVLSGVDEALLRHSRRIVERLREPAQKLREDDARVPARPDKRRIRDGGERLPRRLRDARDLERVGKRDDDVRTGVTVRHRKDVDPIQVVPLALNPDQARRERLVELLSIETADPSAHAFHGGAETTLLVLQDTSALRLALPRDRGEHPPEDEFVQRQQGVPVDEPGEPDGVVDRGLADQRPPFVAVDLELQPGAAG